jgi:hypothetical protein
LHLNQATAQPRSKNPINVATDKDGIIINASTSIPNEKSIQDKTTTQPRSSSPINTLANNYGNIFNPSISVWHEDSVGAQVTMELESSASVEPFPSPIGKRLLHASLINNSPTTPIDQATAQPTVQPSSANQHHCNNPSNTISPQDGTAVENNDSDVDASSGIQQWELDIAAATKQQLYLVENMHASPRIEAKVAFAPVQ